MNRNKKHLIIFSLLLFQLSCKKFIAIDPPKTQLGSALVYTNDNAVKSVVNGIYSRMITSQGFASGGFSSLTYFTSLSADELTNYRIDVDEFSKNALNAGNPNINSSLWKEAYQYIYTANAVLEGLAGSTGVSDPVKVQMQAEVKFIRAFCYFYLVNLFGDVPLHITTDYRVNSTVARSSVDSVYTQIITDLKDAQNLLTDNYPDGERIRPNKAAATALLARTYLYRNDWEHAELEANTIINNSATYAIDSTLNNVFLKNSREAIWQLAPVIPGHNTAEAERAIIVTTPPVTQSLSNSILNAFETNDKRRTNWVGGITDGTDTWYYPYKYKETGTVVKEYYMVLRFAEQYLIRAEARAQQNNIPGAQDDINVIRSRAGLANTTANDKASLLLAIEHERQIELFSEWGHRWFDLKRTNRADAILGPLKQGWTSSDALYPIPQSEVSSNSKITQNDGY